MEDKLTRITINFRKNEEEQKLYDWIKKNSVIGGDSVFIKTILYKEYLKEREGK
ncbi:TPA: hypothetical protein ACY4RS_000307 [Clostridium perfringens]